MSITRALWRVTWPQTVESRAGGDRLRTAQPHNCCSMWWKSCTFACRKRSMGRFMGLHWIRNAIRLITMCTSCRLCRAVDMVILDNWMDWMAVDGGGCDCAWYPGFLL